MLVGLGLRLLHLGFAHLRTGNRVFDKALPARQILSVEHGNKACLLRSLCQELFNSILIVTSIRSVEERKDSLQDFPDIFTVELLMSASDVPNRIAGGGAYLLVGISQKFGGIHETQEGACLLDILQYSRLLVACAGDFHGFAQAQKSVFSRERGVGDERDVAVQRQIEDLVGRSRLANLKQGFGSLQTLPLEQGSEGGVLNNPSVAIQTLEHDGESILVRSCG